MGRLWGEIVPVPEENVRPLAGGETVLGMRVAYTPGHASHHVCYLHEETGTAFVGDVAAVLIPGSNLVVPPTPPPDIDVEAWERVDRIVEGWKPERLALTHFGAVEEPAEHLATVRERLREEAQLARELDEDALRGRHRELVAESAATEQAAAELIQCVPPQYQWRGLDRYWRKREGVRLVPPSGSESAARSQSLRRTRVRAPSRVSFRAVVCAAVATVAAFALVACGDRMTTATRSCRVTLQRRRQSRQIHRA